MINRYRSPKTLALALLLEKNNTGKRFLEI
jgi:hypothetical protein